MKTYPIEKIITCDTCKGSGKVPKPPEHCADDTFSRIKCKTCKGSGRMIEKTTKTITPFVE